MYLIRSFDRLLGIKEIEALDSRYANVAPAAFIPQEIPPGTHLCRRLSRLHGHCAAGVIILTIVFRITKVTSSDDINHSIKNNQSDQ